MSLAAGLWLEGVNFAIGSGLAAGQAAAAAIVAGDVTTAGLASYRRPSRATSCCRTTAACGPPRT